MVTPQVDIIVPVLNDLRILETIKSVRHFDDIDGVRLVIMAATSSEDFLENVRPALMPHDILNTEPDNGIFDALNKGLDLCTAPIMGWLGADDIFTGQIRASDMVRDFTATDKDILVYSTEYHNDNRITRRLSAKWSRKSLIPWGFHNAHFSTFIGQDLYAKNRFPISPQKRNLFSDIIYFADMITQNDVALNDTICTYMAEGGSASGTFRSIKYNFQQRYTLYKDRFGLLNGIAAPVICLGWKLASVAQYKIAPKSCAPLWR